MNLGFLKLNKSIIKCSKCPRLVKFRKKISIEKRKQYQNETYWGKPITGFGDVDGKLGNPKMQLPGKTNDRSGTLVPAYLYTGEELAAAEAQGIEIDAWGIGNPTPEEFM